MCSFSNFEREVEETRLFQFTLWSLCDSERWMDDLFRATAVGSAGRVGGSGAGEISHVMAFTCSRDTYMDHVYVT